MLESWQYEQMVDQIGRRTLMSISGGRVVLMSRGVRLPVSNGYSVVVELKPNDTYTVRREFARKQRGAETIFPKGERTEVYCDDLSEVSYFASCFRSYDASEWVSK